MYVLPQGTFFPLAGLSLRAPNNQDSRQRESVGESQKALLKTKKTKKNLFICPQKALSLLPPFFSSREAGASSPLVVRPPGLIERWYADGQATPRPKVKKR